MDGGLSSCWLLVCRTAPSTYLGGWAEVYQVLALCNPCKKWHVHLNAVAAIASVVCGCGEYGDVLYSNLNKAGSSSGSTVLGRDAQQALHC
jgi:hypothetical protein